jgi:predicted DCC family thiol-disulfide oxidoreductase YuxK
MIGHATPASAPETFAIIIGGMKCGTTSLFDLLAQHPEIAASRVKEPHFFSETADPVAEWDRYVALWDWDAGRHTVALEASTSYAKFPWVPDVPERMAASPATSLRFIYMLRDPVARITSQVRHGLYDGWGTSLDEGMTDDLIDFSRYAMQLDRYMAHFERDRILILTLEELKAAPEPVLAKVCRFLGVAEDRAFVGADVARNTGGFYAASPWIAALVKNRVARWLAARLLSRAAHHRLRERLAASAGRQPTSAGRWQLSDAEIRAVRHALEEDMLRLRRDYGVSAPWLTPGPDPEGSSAEAAHEPRR